MPAPVGQSFPPCQGPTAKLQIVAREELETELFAWLKELAEVVRRGVSERPSAEGTQALPWLTVLAGYLMRRCFRHPARRLIRRVEKAFW